MTIPKIKIDNVSQIYNKNGTAFVVLDNFNLEIAQNEFVTVVGTSGCGKSTLLRVIAGLEDVTSGHIAIDGQDATEVPPAKRGLAMVFLAIVTAGLMWAPETPPAM